MARVRAWAGVWALCAAWLTVGAQAAEPLVPAADFFRVEQMSRPVLSPSGKHLAVHVAAAGGRRRLAVISVQPPRQARIVAGFEDADVGRVQWANDERLVFDIDDHQAAWGERHAPGLFAVDHDGGNPRALIMRDWNTLSEHTTIVSRELRANHGLLRVLRDGSSDVVVQRFDIANNRTDLQNVTPLRLNTQTGRAEPLVLRTPRAGRHWWVDAQGQARAMASVTDGKTETFWRAGPDADWQLIDEHRTFDAKAGSLLDLEIGLDGEVYAESGRGDAAGTTALYRYDPAKRQRAAQPLVSIDGFDFGGHLVFDGRSRRLIGVRYTSDAPGTAWLDDGMKAVQARIDKQLPGLVNLVDPAECGCSRWMVVTSFSDRQPEVYWLYDRETDKLEPVGQSRPQIDPRRMAERDFVRFAARDGLSIPLHVTRPAGKGPWPTVVLVHGGPHVRGGHWSWNGDAQFLASRGYLVLEPEFRGSTGYGGKLFRAGWKQWGLKSQDDIADAARWAIGRGDADPQRLCIAGASYGGYATLMGLIRDPDLYRCGVAWAAVTDINLMFDIPYSDLSALWQQYGMPNLVGDPVKDAGQLVATSPLQQAARLKQPLLMAIGGQDRRVPPVHGTRFRSALAKTNAQLQWVDYPDEGHGFLKLENRVDFMQRVERFLAQQLPPPDR